MSLSRQYAVSVIFIMWTMFFSTCNAWLGGFGIRCSGDRPYVDIQKTVLGLKDVLFSSCFPPFRRKSLRQDTGQSDLFCGPKFTMGAFFEC